jgi:drug/metabolite transporter (DMT)-like permease
VTNPADARAAAPGWLVWTALWIVYIVWGSTYLAIRVVVETLPPFLSGGVRFLIAGTILYAFLAIKRGVSTMRVTRRELVSCALIGTALLLGGNGLVLVAEQQIASGLAALLIATVPLWVILLRKLTGENVSRGTLFGVAVGFVGIALLVLPGESATGADTTGVILVLIAALSWAGGSFISGKLTLPKDPFTSTAVQMMCGGLSLTIAGLVTGEMVSLDIAEFSSASLWAQLYLITIGSWLAFTAYVWLLQNAPISKVATYAYVNPVIAIFLGWALVSEEITATVLIGAAIIVGSVAFTVRHESPPEAAEEPEPAGVLAGSEAG